ncbi:MAG TPA: hypothetical protein VJ987_08945 [Anaerolineales bacterium]|nr:hypothetical protein [Anaerolineales bacterium]
MRKLDFRLTLGGLLILGGVLALLDTMGIIGNAGGIFWGLIWGAVGVFFLYLLVNDRQNNWWAAFPGFILLGMAISSFLPRSLNFLDSLVFFGGISLAFWWVYFTDTSRWWAIIPAGVLLTLGAVSTIDDISGFDTGGLFFIGLGLTFLLVAVLPSDNKQSWAWYPAVALLIFGALVGIPSMDITDYIVPAILILAGGFMLFRFFRQPSSE